MRVSNRNETLRGFFDHSDDPSIEQWRNDQEEFFNGTGDTTSTRYQISPEDG